MSNASDLTADWRSHHIEGITNHGNIPFRAPLVSQITQDGSLWMGGCIDGVKLDDDFAFVVSLYPWEQYQLGPKTARLEVEMYDAGEVPDERQLHDVARIVNAFRTQGKTLVHCQAGLNRSGLVTALALMLSTSYTAEEAIDALRQKRSEAVLCNTAFSRWLIQQEV